MKAAATLAGRIGEMSCWRVPPVAELEPLLVWALSERKVDSLLVATALKLRDSVRDPPEPAVLSWVDTVFGAHVRRRLWARRWPGREMLGHEGLVFVVDFDKSLVRPMVEAGSRLDCWTRWNSRPLPEDLCLFRRGDALPALTSVTHEGDAWLIGERKPPVDNLVPEILDPERLMIPVGCEDFVDGVAGSM